MKFENYQIRPVEIKDVANYYLFINENKERISGYFPSTLSYNKDLESTTAFISDRISLWEKKEFLSFVIVDEHTQRIVGTVFLKDFDWNVKRCEFGFFIDGKYEGKGIISNAVSHVIKWCFSELSLHKIFMRIAIDNTASRRVAEKNNFVAEGILRDDFKTGEGVLVDIVYYGLLNID